MKLIEKKLFERQPDEKTGVISMAAYCSVFGDLMKYCTYVSRSDTFAGSTMSFSTDGGATYSQARPDRTRWETNDGTMTNYFKLTLLDKASGRFYMFYNRGLLPGDNPLEGLKNWQLYYTMSEDGGRTACFDKPVVMTGDYDEFHPIDDVWRGKNSFMVGDWPCLPVLTPGGDILLPVQSTLLDENGEIYNPGGGYTYQCSRVLHGRFMAGGEIEWHSISEKVLGDPEKSTRGAIEPAIALMPDGRILMVMRGSNGGINDPDFRLPGYRWHAVSEDGGHTFTKPSPWTYSGGGAFYSPSSCSQILCHGSGRYFWIGNICGVNPRANMPRNPLCIVEIDTESLMPMEKSKFDIAAREGHQFQDVTFSNFYAREEANTGDILLYCTAMWQSPENIYLDADSYEYRLRP
ncbi:MAG: exo-alpha-sialidase [Clostridia bacterium]|nr:exo-alpha-sialidase [Clostridia bacterium]